VFFVGAMWRERVTSTVDAFVVGMNKTVTASGKNQLAIGLVADQEPTAVEVVGKFGRRHLSPRLMVSWGSVLAFSQGFGSGKVARFYSRSSGPPSTPWTILTRDSNAEQWRAITPAFDPMATERFSSRQGWSWCTC
jgi:hypothetical protein